MYLREVTNALEGCECEVTELPNSIGGSVRGWVTSKECAICKAKREADAIINEQRRLEEERNRKIQERANQITRAQAESELKAEGLI